MLAATFVLMAGMKWGSAVISPVLMALFFAVIITPVYRWLTRKGLAKGLALTIVILFVLAIGIGLILFVVASFGRLIDELAVYQGQLAERESAIGAWLADAGIEVGGGTLLANANPEEWGQWIVGFVGGLFSFAGLAVFMLVTMIFAIAESTDIAAKLRVGIGVENPMTAKISIFVNSLVRYFGIRTLINAITGGAVAIMLTLMGVDFAILWGVLTFFLSYIPYIGITLATIPAVVLAYAEFGFARALLVIVGVLIINFAAENAVAPTLLGKGLSISPLAVFVSFFFWTWLLGPFGMVLAMPLTVLVLFLLDSYTDTRWLALLIGPPLEQEEALAGQDS